MGEKAGLGVAKLGRQANMRKELEIQNIIDFELFVTVAVVLVEGNIYFPHPPIFEAWCRRPEQLQVRCIITRE